MIRMSVAGVHLDSSSGSAVLVLTNPEGRALPILIGSRHFTPVTSLSTSVGSPLLARPSTMSRGRLGEGPLDPLRTP